MARDANAPPLGLGAVDWIVNRLRGKGHKAIAEAWLGAKLDLSQPCQNGEQVLKRDGRCGACVNVQQLEARLRELSPEATKAPPAGPLFDGRSAASGGDR